MALRPVPVHAIDSLTPAGCRDRSLGACDGAPEAEIEREAPGEAGMRGGERTVDLHAVRESVALGRHLSCLHSLHS